MKTNFSRHDILGWHLFIFQHFIELILLSSGFQSFCWKVLCQAYYCYLKVTCLSSFFKRFFSLFLIFSILTTNTYILIYILSCLKFTEPCACWFTVSLLLDYLGLFYLEILLCHILSFFSFWDSSTDLSALLPHSTFLLFSFFYFPLFFSLYSLIWIFSYDLFSSLPILSS